jgi:hypothetical protein
MQSSEAKDLLPLGAVPDCEEMGLRAPSWIDRVAFVSNRVQIFPKA